LKQVLRDIANARNFTIEDDTEIKTLQYSPQSANDVFEMIAVHFSMIPRIHDNQFMVLPPFISDVAIHPETCRNEFRKFLSHIWCSLPGVCQVTSDTKMITLGVNTGLDDSVFAVAVSLRNWLFSITADPLTKYPEDHPVNEYSIDFNVGYYDDGMKNVMKRVYMFVPSVKTIVEEIKALLLFQMQHRMR